MSLNDKNLWPEVTRRSRTTGTSTLVNTDVWGHVGGSAWLNDIRARFERLLVVTDERESASWLHTATCQYGSILFATVVTLSVPFCLLKTISGLGSKPNSEYQRHPVDRGRPGPHRSISYGCVVPCANLTRRINLWSSAQSHGFAGHHPHLFFTAMY